MMLHTDIKKNTTTKRAKYLISLNRKIELRMKDHV